MTQKTSTAQWLAEQQSRAGVSNELLATAMGYESVRVIEMFKSGQMRVPFNKVPPLADVLDIEPGSLMRRLLADADPDLLHAIEQCLGVLNLSDGEQKLIRAVRRVSPGKDLVPITFAPDAIVTLVVA